MRAHHDDSNGHPLGAIRGAMIASVLSAPLWAMLIGGSIWIGHQNTVAAQLDRQEAFVAAPRGINMQLEARR